MMSVERGATALSPRVLRGGVLRRCFPQIRTCSNDTPSTRWQTTALAMSELALARESNGVSSELVTWIEIRFNSTLSFLLRFILREAKDKGYGGQVAVYGCQSWYI